MYILCKNLFSKVKNTKIILYMKKEIIKINCCHSNKNN